MAEIKAEIGASGDSASVAPSRGPRVSKRKFLKGSAYALGALAGAGLVGAGIYKGAVELMAAGVKKGMSRQGVTTPPSQGGGVDYTQQTYDLISKGIKENERTLQQGSSDLQGQASPDTVTKRLVSPYLEYYDNPKSVQKDSYVHFHEIDRPGPILLAATEGPTWYARPAIKKELENLAGRPITDRELKEMRDNQQKSIVFLTELYREEKISRQALEFYSQTPDQLLQQAKEQFPRYFP